MDSFTDAWKHQLSKFNLRYKNPSTEAVDAFTCDWGGENSWWCPPIYLIPWLLRHACVTKAMGTLILLQWLSAPFWPLLYPDGIYPAEFIQGVLELPRRESHLSLDHQFLTSLKGSIIHQCWHCDWVTLPNQGSHSLCVNKGWVNPNYVSILMNVSHRLEGW